MDDIFNSGNENNEVLQQISLACFAFRTLNTAWESFDDDSLTSKYELLKAQTTFLTFMERQCNNYESFIERQLLKPEFDSNKLFVLQSNLKTEVKQTINWFEAYKTNIDDDWLAVWKHGRKNVDGFTSSEIELQYKNNSETLNDLRKYAFLEAENLSRRLYNFILRFSIEKNIDDLIEDPSNVTFHVPGHIVVLFYELGLTDYIRSKYSLSDTDFANLIAGIIRMPNENTIESIRKYLTHVKPGVDVKKGGKNNPINNLSIRRVTSQLAKIGIPVTRLPD